MKTEAAKILVYGYGNPGRQDDGLGAALVQLLEQWLIENPDFEVDLDCNYQLNIEDADAIAGRKMVIFVDATIDEAVDNFHFSRLSASDARVEFTMHAVSPAFVLDLCRKIHGNCPEAWLLQIKGYSWEFEERLTKKAEQNLFEATAFLKGFLLKAGVMSKFNEVN